MALQKVPWFSIGYVYRANGLFEPGTQTGTVLSNLKNRYAFQGIAGVMVRINLRSVVCTTPRTRRPSAQ
jgi:hypothetical protein